MDTSSPMTTGATIHHYRVIVQETVAAQLNYVALVGLEPQHDPRSFADGANRYLQDFATFAFLI